MIFPVSSCSVTVHTHQEGPVSSGPQLVWTLQLPPSLLGSVMEWSGEGREKRERYLHVYVLKNAMIGGY